MQPSPRESPFSSSQAAGIRALHEARSSAANDGEQLCGVHLVLEPLPTVDLHDRDPDAVLAEDITVTKEEITEKNRIIIKVKVTSPKKETSYSIVQYNWGGRFFFRESTSINETLFTLWTGVSP